MDMKILQEVQHDEQHQRMLDILGFTISFIKPAKPVGIGFKLVGLPAKIQIAKFDELKPASGRFDQSILAGAEEM
jgi:hypothetical protein